MGASPNPLWSVLYGAGMVLLYVGERVIGAGTSRGLASSLGALLLVLALVGRVLRLRTSKGDARVVEMWLLQLYAVGAFSVWLYFFQSDLSSLLHDGKPLTTTSPRLATALLALWPAVWLAAAAPIVLVEVAYASVARAPRLEKGRILDALASGLGLAGALVFAFSFAYVASERDKKVDLSYFRTAKAGEATHKIVASLDQPLTVSLFFPPANEVREELNSYFADLKKESHFLEVQSYDHAVDPAKAKELGVSGNGIVVISRGGRREQLSVGLELEAARNQLRNLDKEVQKRILQVAKPGRTVYLTAGHGERSSLPSGDTDKRVTIRDLKELLQQQGYAVKDLGAAEGLAADVPADAAIVGVIGPQKPLFAEEAASIARYLDRGGRVFLALDPESGLDEKELLGPLGLKYVPTALANDQLYAKRTNQVSDRGNIATGSYSSHPSVTTLGRLGMRAPMVLLGAGWIEETKDKPPLVSIDFTVRSHPTTFNDLNGNFAYDPPAESRKAWQVAAALVKKKSKEGQPKDAKPNASDEGRLLLLADSDALGDGILGNPGNAYFILDGTKWLLGDEAIQGEVSSEVDVPIQHTHKQDVLWFYSTIFVAPALSLGVGWWVNRRRKGKKVSS
jgi:hypothetical protein